MLHSYSTEKLQAEIDKRAGLEGVDREIRKALRAGYSSSDIIAVLNRITEETRPKQNTRG